MYQKTDWTDLWALVILALGLAIAAWTASVVKSYSASIETINDRITVTPKPDDPRRTLPWKIAVVFSMKLPDNPPAPLFFGLAKEGYTDEAACQADLNSPQFKKDFKTLSHDVSKKLGFPVAVDAACVDTTKHEPVKGGDSV